MEEIIRRYGADETDFQILGIGYEYLALDNNSSDKTQLDVVCEKLFEITQSQNN